jgi:three-Cys-motif partner protein
VTNSKSKGPNLEVRPDPCPSLVVERGPEDEGVGSWVPLQKHKLLCEYLHATRHAWKAWPNRVLIDPFAGPGRIQVRGESGTREGGTVLAWRTLAEVAPFSKVLVGDIDSERAKACKSRLDAVSAPAQVFVGPAVETVHQMVSEVPKGALCMAYIDPYSLQYLSFSILKALAPLKVDLAINFSTMDLWRNIANESNPDRTRFDDAAPGWRDHIDERGTSRSGMPLAFFNYWRGLVSALNFEHSEEMPFVLNDRGTGIYRMIFFARHDLPKRIWADVARGPNLELDF